MLLPVSATPVLKVNYACQSMHASNTLARPSLLQTLVVDRAASGVLQPLGDQSPVNLISIFGAARGGKVRAQHPFFGPRHCLEEHSQNCRGQ